MSEAIPQLSDRVSTAARAVWAAVEAIEALTPDDLRDAGLDSVAGHSWMLADDDLERRIEAARRS